MSDSPLGDKLTRLAEGVLDELLTPGNADIDQRIDAVKVIGTLYLGLRKQYKEPEPEESSLSLKAIRERVKAAEEGK